MVIAGVILVHKIFGFFYTSNMFEIIMHKTPNTFSSIPSIDIKMKRTFTAKREQALKKLKTAAPKPDGKALDVTPIPDESPKETFPECGNFESLDLDVTTYVKRGDSKESIPKVHKAGDTRQRNVSIRLPPMMAHWCYLTGNGNYQKGTYGPRDLKKAKFTFTGYPGVPDEVKSAFLNLEGEQERALEDIKKYCDKAMGVAFHDPNTWNDACSSHDDDSSFIAGASHSCLKTKMIDGDETLALCMQRQLEAYGGGDNTMAFWRLNEKNEYIRVEPKYITNKSLLSVELIFRAFRRPDGGYGMAADMGKNVFVAYAAPMDKKPVDKAVPQYPYVPFDI